MHPDDPGLDVAPTGSERTRTLDSDDEDPSQPIPSQIDPVSVPILAEHGGNGDGDYVPASVTVTWLDVTADRINQDPMPTCVHRHVHAYNDHPGR